MLDRVIRAQCVKMYREGGALFAVIEDEAEQARVIVNITDEPRDESGRRMDLRDAFEIVVRAMPTEGA